MSIELPVRAKLVEPNKTITHVYFITSGLASVVAIASRNRRLEIGIFGREGISGESVIMGADRSPHETYMQIPGSALRMRVDSFVRAIANYPDLRRGTFEFARSFNLQVAQTALVTAHHSLEQRLARWLLMASDRTDSNQLPLTHEFMSLMLGVRRAGVTTSLSALREKRAIRTGRGFLSITDRDVLIQAANGAYFGANKENVIHAIRLRSG